MAYLNGQVAAFHYAYIITSNTIVITAVWFVVIVSLLSLICGFGPLPTID